MNLTTLKTWCALFALCISYLSSQGQAVKTPVEVWNTQEGTQYNFYESPLVTDGSGNIYKTGATVNASGNYDILVSKYNSSGTQLWVDQYAGAGSGDDMGASIAVDGSGNVYVVGTVYTSSSDSNDCVLLKYNSSGNLQWDRVYDGGMGRSDGGSDIVLNGTDIYICGVTYTSSTDEYDFLVISYDNTGTQQWRDTWDNIDLWDGATNISYRSGVVSVAGGTQISSTRYDYASAAWSSSGTFQSSATQGGSNPIGFNKITGMVTDASGNIYITGYVTNTNFDCYTVKLNSALVQQWSATYNSGSIDVANDIMLDASGNVYITGYAMHSTQGKNFLTIKYNSSGTQQWAVTYNGYTNGDDEGNAIAINSSGDVYVSGWSYNGENKDYQTMKLNPSNGSMVWEIPFNAVINADDRATDMVIDGAGDIIVTGQAQRQSGEKYFHTVKYKEIDVITPPDTLSKGWQFIENRGQVLGSDNVANAEVQFYNDKAGPMVYFQDGVLSYVMSNKDTIHTDTDTLTRVDMTLANDVNGTVYPLSLRRDYHNYFLPQVSGERGMVPLYNRLIVPGAYSNIDVMYASNARGLRIYYIIKPGGSPSSIQMTYAGASSVTVNGSGALVLATALGNITHPKATAFEINSSGQRVNLAWQPTYNLVSTNNVKFSNIGTYTTTNTLVIEMNYGPPSTASSPALGNINWSTYYGGSVDDQFDDIQINPNGTGEIYTCGYTISTNFPVQTGTVQDVFAAGEDAVVLKFDTLGQRLWATFYGGSLGDQAYGLDVDVNGNVYFTGHTKSSNFPTYDPQPSTTAGAYYDSTYGTGSFSDIFIVKLNPAGTTRQWATYYGASGSGTSVERGIEIGKDIYNNLVVVGISWDATPTVNKPGSYHSTTGNGWIMKFNPSDSLIWATKLPGADRIEGVGFLSPYTLITGDAGSTALPTKNPGGGAYYDNTYGSGGDAFVMAFNQNDTITWGTYYGGSGNEDCNAIYADKQSQKIYIAGYTGSNPFPVKDPGNGAWVDSIPNTGSGGDVFVAEFSATGVLNWGTVYGGFGSDYGYDVIANNTNIYVTGWTTTSGVGPAANIFECVNVTNAYFQDTLKGGQDAFILAFDKNTRQRRWVTLVGGGGSGASEAGWGIVTDNNRNYLYTVGYTKSRGNIPNPYHHYPLADPGFPAWFEAQLGSGTNNSTYMDGYITRFGTQVITALAIGDIYSNFNYDIGIYPNPTTDNVNVVFDLKEKQNVEINVYSIMGARIFSEDLGERIGEFRRVIDLADVSSGMYIVQVQINGQAVAKKIIKQ